MIQATFRWISSIFAVSREPLGSLDEKRRKSILWSNLLLCSLSWIKVLVELVKVKWSSSCFIAYKPSVLNKTKRGKNVEGRWKKEIKIWDENLIYFPLKVDGVLIVTQEKEVNLEMCSLDALKVLCNLFEWRTLNFKWESDGWNYISERILFEVSACKVFT